MMASPLATKKVNGRSLEMTSFYQWKHDISCLLSCLLVSCLLGLMKWPLLSHTDETVQLFSCRVTLCRLVAVVFKIDEGE